MGIKELKDLENRFTYHAPPDHKTINKYYQLRTLGKELAIKIADFCPDGREKSLAITKIEEAVMWANAAIARQ